MRTVSEVMAMLELHRHGWGIRRIAAELGAERKTVRKYIRAGQWSGYKPRVYQQVIGREARIGSDASKIQRSGGLGTSEVSGTSQLQKRANAEVSQRRWLHSVMQGLLSKGEIESATGKMDELGELIRRIHECRLPERNKAVSILAARCHIPSRVACEFLGIDRKSFRRYCVVFEQGGAAALFARQAHYVRKANDPKIKQAVFTLLHEPPASHDINRTTWKMADLVRILRAHDCKVCSHVIREITTAAGYKWRKARTVLTSKDPDYAEKVARVHAILSTLSADEAFFSIDEFGPFAVKMKGGLSLMPSGKQRIVPQWQHSKGCLILTAALDLASNQATHFYSTAKNTGEMIRMMDVLVAQYAHCRRIYLSWDAASWHISKRLGEHIERHNAGVENSHLPCVETAPLPVGAQFLNVIESVFSGMARAIIHNSDYGSLEQAKLAIDRYLCERNIHFQQNPRRAGKKIWGQEREPATFSAGNNCKDPHYR